MTKSFLSSYFYLLPTFRLHKKTEQKVEFYDKSSERTNVDYMVNAQGRVENWKNSIGRYLIGTLQWKF